ncbi:MAG: type II secretion system protein [Chloroflexi bacterium]|nr:type II secretion system protein [Chloroflexota bacterium]
MIKRLLKKQAGFTLVELLVVVAIVVGLAAAIIPNVSRFSDSGRTGGAASEINTLQASLDAAIADNNITTVTAQSAVSDFSSTGAEDFTGDPLAVPSTAKYLYPDYLRIKDAAYGPYSWDVNGLVTRD